MAKEFNFTLRGNADVSQIIQAINNIKSVADKADLGSAFNKQFTNVFKNLNENAIKLGERLSEGLTDEKAFKEATKYSNALSSAYATLYARAEALAKLSNAELANLIPKESVKQIEDAKKALDNYNNSTQDLSTKLKDAKQAATEADNKLTTIRNTLNTLKDKQILSKDQIQENQIRIKGLTSEIDNLKNKLGTKAKNGVLEQVKNYRELEKTIDATVRAFEEYQKKNASKGWSSAQMEGNFKKTKAGSGADMAAVKQFLTTGANEEVQEYLKLEQELDKVIKEKEDLQAINKESRDTASALSKAEKDESAALEDQAKANQKVTELTNQSANALNVFRQELANIQGVSLNEIPEDFEAIKDYINNLEPQKIREVREALQDVADAARDQKAPVQAMGEAINQTTEEYKQFNEQLKYSKELTNKVKQFFTAANAIQLFRKAVTSAFNDVKELDKIMTETAVVTPFSVSDMWNKMPQYTDQANQLGVAISDAYKAATLYYQQGLKTDKVMGVSAQTLKMARIAGMDATDATNKMTAALRGFNMEVNETNAERISDVYSKLAAITASNVQEISNAMTKTASLASNAGMQFETTAAFLSQIIETTRESAETAGTALKTVIARFQELKKDPSEIGEVDGEIIDANKIETALRTVGVSLRDASGQFRELDQVFLELSSKWDSLDTNTQRYIATIAAGSRQQSRFIAMMSNYSRTQELVSAANNAAGASNQQYEKTLDSLETKLNQLKNAWTEFTTSITNSSLIKGAVDLLTGLIQVINKVTSILPGATSGFAKLGIAAGAIKFGGKVWGAFSALPKELGPVKNMTTALSKEFGELGKVVKKVFTKDTWKNGILQNINENFRNLSGNSIDLAGMLNETAAAQQGLSTQTEIYNSALWAGISPAQAKLALGLSNAEADALQEKLSENLTEEQYKQILSEGLLAKQQQIGILTKTKNIAVLLFGGKAARQAAADNLQLAGSEAAKAVADGTATASQWALNAAIYACPLGWILVIIVAVIAALAALAVALYKSSDAAKMKELDEAIKSLDDSIQNTKSDIDNLSTSWEKLVELQDTLSGMTKGTSAWKMQVQQVNQAVLDLISQYPFLAKYKSLTDDGVLTISTEGYQALSDYLLNILIADENARVGIEGQKKITGSETLKTGGKLHAFMETLLPTDAAGYSRISSWSNEKQAKIIELANTYSTDDWEEFITQVGLVVADATGVATETFKNGIKENEEKIRAFQLELQNMKTDISTSSVETALSSFDLDKDTLAVAKDVLIEKTDITAWENYEKKISQASGTGYDNAVIAEYAKEFNVDEEVARDRWKELQSDGKDIKVLAREVYEKSILNKQQRQANTVAEAIRQFPILAKLGNEGKKLTQDDIDKFSISENFEKYREALDVTEEYLKKIIKNGLTSLDNAKKLLPKELKTNDVFNKLSAELIEGLAESFSSIYQVQGLELTQDLMEDLQKVFDTGIDQEKFVSALNAVTINDLDSWETFLNNLQGLDIDPTNKAIQTFVKNMSEAANATHKVDPKKIHNALESTGNFVKTIREGEQSRTFSKDEYEKITNVNPDLIKEFQIDLEGNYIYLGNSMDNLAEALAENTEALLHENIKVLTNQVKAGEALSGLEFQQPGNLTEAINNLDEYINILKEQGVDLDWVQIQGLGNNIDTSKISSLDEANRLIQELYNLVKSQIDNESKLEEVTGELPYSYLQSRITQNSIIGGSGEDDYNRYRALGTQAALAGVDDIKLKKYLDSLQKMNKIVDKNSYEYREAANEVERFGRELANDVSLKQANEQLSTLFETANETAESYENLTNETAKLIEANSIASKFGFEVDKDNVDEFMSLVNQMITEGSEQAYIELIGRAAREAGYEGKFIKKELEKWMNDEAGKEFAESLHDGLVVFEDQVNKEGVRLRIEPELKDALTTAGTGKDNAWENPYDWIYNMNEKLNSQIKRREKAERDYEAALEDTTQTTAKLVEQSQLELDALNAQNKIQEQMASNARAEISKNRENYGNLYDQYINYDEAGRIIRVNYELIGNQTDEWGENFEAYVSRLEQLRDVINDAEEAIDENNSEMKKIRNRGRQEYIDYEQKILDALVNYYTKEIDKLEEIDNTIHDTNADLIQSMQDSVSKMRKERENQRIEEDLSDKQRRLAYLQMDTSGSNATEILRLQDEIQKDQESLTDNLVDQALEEMTKANDEAQQQRQQQIEIMRKQLEYQQANGELWPQVYDLWAKAFDENGMLKLNSELVEILKQADDFAGKSGEAQNQWWEDAIKEGKIANAWKAALESYEPKDPGNVGGESVTGIKLTNIKGDTEKIVENTSKIGNEASSRTDPIQIIYISGEEGRGASVIKGDERKFWNGMNMGSIEDLFKTASYKYDTGGIADYTGPAWLDGTPSKPELVLNSTDTQNFLALRNILAGLASDGTSIAGDTYYDVDISVDSLTNDYDVEQLADKIKSMITTDATYRNVNALNRLR